MTKYHEKHIFKILKLIFIFELIYNLLTLSALGPSTYNYYNFIEFLPSILEVN